MYFYSAFIIPAAIILTHNMRHKIILHLDIRDMVRYTLKRQTDITGKCIESCGLNSDELKPYSEISLNSATTLKSACHFICVFPTLFRLKWYVKFLLV